MAVELRQQQPDWEITLGTLNREGDWSAFAEENGFSTVCFGEGNYRKLLRNIRAEEYDIVYAMGLRLSFGLRLLKPFLKGVRLIHGIRWSPEGNTKLDKATRLVERWLGFLMHHYITNAQSAANVLVQRCAVPESKTSVIYNGIRLPESEPSAYASRPNNILTIANLAPRKGYIEYLNVIERVVRKVPDAMFHFIGKDAMDGQVQQAIAEKGLQNSVHYHGFCSDVAQHLQKARVFVLPSQHSEGCPTAMLEAMAYKMPVCGYRINGVAELVEEGRTGLLAKAGDEESLAEYLIALLQDESKAEQMGDVGYARVKEHFMLEQCAAKHKKVLEACAA